MSIRHHFVVTSSAAISTSLQQASSSLHNNSSSEQEEDYNKLGKMQPSSSILSTIFASNVCLYVALVVIFVVWLLMMAKSLNINVAELTHTAMDTILQVDDLEDLPSYVLDKKSYYDLLPGYLSGGSSSSSVLPDYYLRDDDLVKHYPRYYPLIDILEAWPPKDVSRSQWRKSMAHPLFGAKNEEKYYSSHSGRSNMHHLKVNSDSSTSTNEEQQRVLQQIPNGLYRLNYRNETELAIAYKLRDKEVPYILYNVPELDEAARSDFSADALQLHFGSLPRVVEKSQDNEFMYYTVKETTSSIMGRQFSDWKPPQQDILMSFRTFLREAIEAETKNNIADKSSQKISDENLAKKGKYKEKDAVDLVGPRSLHYLIIAASEGSRTKWIRHALPFFEPKDSLFMREPEQYRGVNCRFGMKGIISAPHYDSRTNYIAMIRGRKRYILQPPSECNKLELLPRGHPSARHSAVVWSNLTEVSQYPNLMSSRATEVVLSMGELLYLPSYWFHYIISQDASIQCNARSGESTEGKEYIEKCGFSRRFGKKSVDSPEGQGIAEGGEVDDVQEQVDQKSKQFEASEGLSDTADGLSNQRQKRMRRHKKGSKGKKRQGIDWSMQ